MPGFVDVSHMSNEEVRRMGHADDYDEDTNRRSYRNPYAYRKPTAPKENISFTADDMWAAAWQAYAINGNQYVKALLPGVPEDQPQPNRAIAERLLANPEQITEESRQVGGVMRRYFQGLTFKLIEGKKLTPFLQSAFDAANKDEITSKYDLAVIVSLPATYEKSVKRKILTARSIGLKVGILVLSLSRLSNVLRLSEKSGLRNGTHGSTVASTIRIKCCFSHT